VIQKVVQFILGIFRYHKLKLFVILLSAVMFAFFRFPIDDLGDVVSAKISESTQGQIFCQFDRMGLALIPQPSLSLENVDIETPVISHLKTEELKLSVSIPALLAFRIGFVVDAYGLFRGQAYASFHEGEKNKDGTHKYVIRVGADKLDLADVKKAMDLPVNLRGAFNAKIDSTVDPSFADQPESEVQISVASLEMPASTVATPFGPMNLPTLKWSNVNLKGRLIGGKFIVEDGKLGTTQDALNGQVKGSMDVRVARVGNQPYPEFGAYDFKVELNVNKGVEKEFSLFLSLLDSYKSPSLSGSRYLFRASGVQFGTPPRFSGISSLN
jgi:type II secretion system protein N